MRIEKLRFCNINSLRGTWSLDLEDPELQDSGLFLITGPTGSGKSTLLDAICLALYGQTPRLASISKSGNEAMTRHTGMCFSEVIYSTDTGRYRARWAQARARKKADGNLQPPACEFEDYASPGQAETKTTVVRSLVEKTTGMTFEQFTRSMLLAQGQFAKFLQAAPNDRTTILEQITGTEIYSRISARAYELAKAENERYTGLASRLEGIQVLSDEERAQREAQFADTKKRLAALQRDLEQGSWLLSWLKKKAELEAALAGADKELARATELDRQSLADRERLALDVRAAALDRELLAADRDRASEERLTRDLAAQTATIPLLEEKAREAAGLLAEQGKIVARAEEALSTASPILARARELDASLGTVLEQKKARERENGEILARQEQFARDREELCARRKTCLDTLAQLCADLEKSARDAGLAEDIRAIGERLKALEAAQKVLASETKSLGTAQRDRAAAEKALAKLESMAAKAMDACSERAALREQAQARLASCLGALPGQGAVGDVQGLRKAERDCDALLRGMGRVRDDLGEYLAAARALDETAGESAACSAREEQMRALLPERTKSRQQAEDCVKAMEESLRLAAAIKSLEQHRASLKEGEPCPCCGSLDHPWASGVTMDFASEQRLARKKAELKAATQEEQKVAQDLRAAQSLAERLRQDRKKGEESLAKRARALGDDLAELAPLVPVCAGQIDVEEIATLARRTEELARGGTDAELAGAWEEAAKKLASVLKTVSATVRSAEKLEKECQKLDREHAKAVTDLARANGARESARVALESLVTQETEQGARVAGAQRDCEKACADVFQAIQPYGLGEDDINRGAVANILAKRLALRANLEAGKKAQEENRTAIERDMAALDTGIAETGKRLAALGQSLGEITAQCEALRASRRELLGDKKPDAEEQRLRKALSRAQAGLESAKAFETKAQGDLALARERAKNLGDEQARAQAQYRASLASLEEGLARQGFASREALLAARLDETRARLCQEAVDRAREALTRATTSHEACKKALAEHMLRPEGEQAREIDRAELEESMAAMTSERDALQQSLGVVSEQLEHDAAERKRKAEELKALERQREVACQWQDLSSLIGSADGAKFRRFAQSVTFGRLVACANREMKTLTDRYLLATDPQNALEFNVIDTYQGNEQRSIRNLSGGETFLVSLALALGLAHLSGGRMRIETMFLDEGFGTLDPETLDGAITTLAALRGRGTGLIGIISHVEALQERVETQIILKRGADGVSTLSGPGCGKG